MFDEQIVGRLGIYCGDNIKINSRELDCFALWTDSRYGPAASFYDHNDKPSVLVETEFLEQSTIQERICHVVAISRLTL